MPEPINIISLGAGVQSSTMALMAAKGEFGKYAGKYNEKVNKELRDLAESVYGKKAAKELIGERGTEERKPGAPAELP